MLELHLGYEVVEDAAAGLPLLRAPVAAALEASGLQLLDQAPDQPGAWWSLLVVVGWRGSGEQRRLVVSLELERPQADGQGQWWRDQRDLGQTYAPAAVAAVVLELLQEADRELPTLLPGP